ncbi:hypothetical protein PV08_04738 [Exophiala spinifera]|uniref:BD-FAE-like domain-containing protein n=1 Tax=Exophiala spinifera TaxID=91928 RepID=A0A0D2C1L4_9EURO|nr:uncharacterized protein PV08_04738 [Exophiala spinifera]KIW17544.1 hypothetical protein PV08_04738 [Exophiala spinifera]
MDQLPPFGKAIGLVIPPTNGVYAPLLAKNASAILSANKTTFAYGADPRQQLDLYTPSQSEDVTDKSSPRPLLVFVYGGGFANGDKSSEAKPLVYQNLGYFFSEKTGLETIIIDYRLIKHGAKFPSGGEDVDAALQWIAQKYGGQKRDVYLFGNSAGGINVATWLFEPLFQKSRQSLFAGVDGVKVSGAILLGALFDFRQSSPPLRQALTGYFGEELDQSSTVALLDRIEPTGELSSGPWPRFLIVDSELDPDDIIKADQDVLRRLKDVPNLDVGYVQIKGHNHISPPLALGTSIAAEEEWGYNLASWVKGSA